MSCLYLLMFLCIIQIATSDWISEWVLPVQEQLEEQQYRKTGADADLKQFEDEYEETVREAPTDPTDVKSHEQVSMVALKLKLETTLENARELAKTLKAQILEVSSNENTLKEAITNGRSGISTVVVSTMDERPRSYIIRDGLWTLCTGIVQAPSAAASSNMYNGLFSTPRCIGQEVPTRQDPCVFNSMIKYETIPTQRRLVYSEDDYLCLKSSFNTTLERYMSVPRRLINDTCENGVIRSLEENKLQCGIRVLSEYSYYPHRRLSTSLPLEYCTEGDGSCRLIVAWHVSNSTVENFEFLKNEQNFKKFFLKNSFLDNTSM